MNPHSEGRYEEYGDVLRRALHAEADGIMPTPDGLERIRTKIGEKERRFGWNWFTASWIRPAVAAGAALGLTFLVVSAPPAIQQITSAGDQSSAPHQSTLQPSHESSVGQPVSSSYPVQPVVPSKMATSQAPSVSATATCPPTATTAASPSTPATAKTGARRHKSGASTCPTVSPTPTTTAKSPSPTPTSSTTSASSTTESPAAQTQAS